MTVCPASRASSAPGRPAAPGLPASLSPGPCRNGPHPLADLRPPDFTSPGRLPSWHPCLPARQLPLRPRGRAASRPPASCPSCLPPSRLHGLTAIPPPCLPASWPPRHQGHLSLELPHQAWFQTPPRPESPGLLPPFPRACPKPPTSCQATPRFPASTRFSRHPPHLKGPYAGPPGDSFFHCSLPFRPGSSFPPQIGHLFLQARRP